MIAGVGVRVRTRHFRCLCTMNSHFFKLYANATRMPRDAFSGNIAAGVIKGLVAFTSVIGHLK